MIMKALAGACLAFAVTIAAAHAEPVTVRLLQVNQTADP